MPSPGQSPESSATACVCSLGSSSPRPAVLAPLFERSNSGLGPKASISDLTSGLLPHAPFTQQKQPQPLRRFSQTRAAPTAFSRGLKDRRTAAARPPTPPFPRPPCEGPHGPLPPHPGGRADPAEAAGAEPEGHRARCVRRITGPPELPPPPRLRLSSHKSVTGRRGRGGGKGAGENGGTGPGQGGERRTDKQPRPPHSASPSGPPSAPPLPPHLLPQQQPGPALRQRPPPPPSARLRDGGGAARRSLPRGTRTDTQTHTPPAWAPPSPPPPAGAAP